LEIEREILSHPKILEAAVIGIPDDIQGEKLVAVIVARKESSVEPKELQGYLKTKLASYKIPRTEVFRDVIERNHLGKVS
jgi:acyl-CoA synthetase (AMP-forming)/AMP-acid ligase II